MKRREPVSDRWSRSTGLSDGPQGGNAALSARSISRAEGVNAFQALQRVLYRSAKQDPKRRFHALYDKLTRRDVMWRAWVDVATNQGAPGVDGVSIADIDEGGVEAVRAFLDELAAELEAETYRPQPLRRVNIPKPGQPGKTRPLSIPCVRDRVMMTAAKSILEPIFEAEFLPCSFGFRPKRSAHQALEVVRATVNKGRSGCLTPTSRTALAVCRSMPSSPKWNRGYRIPRCSS